MISESVCSDVDYKYDLDLCGASYYSLFERLINLVEGSCLDLDTKACLIEIIIYHIDAVPIGLGDYWEDALS